MDKKDSPQMVVLEPGMHRKVKIDAARKGKTIREIVHVALEEHFKAPTLKDNTKKV